MIGWQIISAMPDSLKDGREVLLWNDDYAVVGQWAASGAHFGMGDPGWAESHEGSALENVSYFAEITSPR